MTDPISPATSAASPSRPLRLLLAVVPIAAVALLGFAATVSNVPTWYAGLAKPPLTPPDAVFGPVWTVLYLSIGWAVWRVLGAPPTAKRRQATSWFFLQLALNGLWPPVFFAAHQTMAGLVAIVLLLATIIVTIRTFARVDRAAALAFVPYAAWTAFAAYLNAGIVVLNR